MRERICRTTFAIMGSVALQVTANGREVQRGGSHTEPMCCSSGALPPELSPPYLPPEDRRNYKIFRRGTGGTTAAVGGPGSSPTLWRCSIGDRHKFGHKCPFGTGTSSRNSAIGPRTLGVVVGRGRPQADRGVRSPVGPNGVHGVGPTGESASFYHAWRLVPVGRPIVGRLSASAAHGVVVQMMMDGRGAGGRGVKNSPAVRNLLRTGSSAQGNVACGGRGWRR